MPESQEEDPSSQLNDMQQELHSKGTVLTRAWSELFSFLNKYQAELMVKENAVVVAEKEVDIRKRQLEDMRPVGRMDTDTSDSEEISRLRSEILSKERLLNRAQLELSASEQTVKRISLDLSNHMLMVERSRSELSGMQTELVRYRNDVDRLKSELNISNEQVEIKDKLLNKLQNQLMKENAELKEQLDFSLRALDLEKKAHALTKKLRERGKSDLTSPNTTNRSSTEIPELPPTLDLSLVRDDFGLTNIVPQSGSNKTNSTTTGPSINFAANPSNPIGVFPTWTPLMSPLQSTGSPILSPNTKPAINSTNSSANSSFNSTETFFPLTISSMEQASKTATNMITSGPMTSMQMNTNLKSPASVSGPVLNVPSLATMDIMSMAGSSGSYSDGKWTVLKVETGEEVTQIEPGDELGVQECEGIEMISVSEEVGETMVLKAESGEDTMMDQSDGLVHVQDPIPGQETLSTQINVWHHSSPLQTGMQFQSFEEFKTALHEYERQKHVKFIVGHSRTCAIYNAKKHGKRCAHERLKYVYARYLCKHGKVYESRGSGKRPNQSSCKLNCQACLFIKADVTGQKLLIKEMNEIHNHAINPGKLVKRKL